MIVVIPTCRGVDLSRLVPLIDYGARFIVVDDSEGSVTVNHPQFEVHDWRDRRRRLGRREVCIPKRTGACRDFGFYLAWHEGDAEEIIIAIDDDCVIEDEDFPLLVEASLGNNVRPIARGAGSHFNTFDLYASVDGQISFPRGFPYSARVDYVPWTWQQQIAGRVDFNLGLWTGAFDINAVDKIDLERSIYPDATLKENNVVIPAGALISVCSGNMHFRRELVPAAYQLPMNVVIMEPWVLDRYGDIWAGFILKILMDVRGDRMSAGGPLVNHGREAPFLPNVAKEHLAHLVNEEFIDLLGYIAESLEPGSYFDMMRQFHDECRRRANSTSPVLKRYLAGLDESLAAWLSTLN